MNQYNIILTEQTVTNTLQVYVQSSKDQVGERTRKKGAKEKKSKKSKRHKGDTATTLP